MWLNFFVIENVHHFDAARFQVIRDQRAMTPPPNRLGAHDRGGPGFLHQIDKPLDAFATFAGFES